MNLTLFFKLISQVIFQPSIIQSTKSSYYNEKMCYDNTRFYCPTVYANDGFNVSLQIGCGNYCSSENGHRQLGLTWDEVEFGFPSENEPLMHKYAEMYGYDEESDKTIDITNAVGRIPVSVMEKVFAKHGGIDWVKSCQFQEKDAK